MRHMSGKAGKKGPPAKGGAAVAAPEPVAPPVKQQTLRPETLVARKPLQKVDSLQLLSAEQRALATVLIQPAPSADPQQPPPAEPVALTSLKQLSLPLDAKDVVDLVHQSLSAAVGQGVQLRPYVFSNLFQSGPVVADYVAAALEAEYAWPRVERFFLSSIEADPQVRGIKIRISGRQGRKATKASERIWEWGDLTLRRLEEAVDYGHATAMTRMGSVGVKVWLRYHKVPVVRKTRELVKTNLNPSQHAMFGGSSDGDAPPAIGLMPLPWRSATAWWATPGPLQPASHASWECLKADFNPLTGSRQEYAASMTPLVFTAGRQRERHLKPKDSASPQPAQDSQQHTPTASS